MISRASVPKTAGGTGFAFCQKRRTHRLLDIPGFMAYHLFSPFPAARHSDTGQGRTLGKEKRML